MTITETHYIDPGIATSALANAIAALAKAITAYAEVEERRLEFDQEKDRMDRGFLPPMEET